MWEVSFATGLGIPSGLIAGCGLAFYRLVYPELGRGAQQAWLLCYAAVWITYGVAVLHDPGKVDLARCRAATSRGQAKYLAWCGKCRAPKPERAHHCRKCRRCVLRMDHHCPWTGNCVGHANMPHFVRFLIAASFETGWTGLAAVRTGYRTWWTNAERPGYLSSRLDVAILALLIPVALFLCVTISALLIRVLLSISNGNTLIEEWERERAAVLLRRKLAPRAVFPFDNGAWANVTQALGSPLAFVLPLFGGGPTGDGHSWQRSEDGPRWPPDSQKAQEHDFYRRDRWISPEGESLEDFGVDPCENSGLKQD